MAERPPRLGPLSIRFELGLASFAPALGLLAFRTRDSRSAWLLLAAALAGLLVIVVGVGIVRRGNTEPFEFGDIEDLGGEILGHIGAYLVPVFISSTATTEEVVISWVILALIIQIHIATGRVFVNPLLYLIGYRVYSAQTGGASYYLIARSDVSGWSTPKTCVQIGSSVLVERSRKGATR